MGTGVRLGGLEYPWRIRCTRRYVRSQSTTARLSGEKWIGEERRLLLQSSVCPSVLFASLSLGLCACLSFLCLSVYLDLKYQFLSKHEAASSLSVLSLPVLAVYIASARFEVLVAWLRSDDNIGLWSLFIHMCPTLPRSKIYVLCGRLFCRSLSVRAHATAFIVKAEKGYLLTAAHTFLEFKLEKSDNGSDDGEGSPRQGEWQYYEGVTNENCIVLVRQ